MSVVVSNESTGPCQREIKIEVPAPAVEAETSRVTAEYRKKARVRGFRPGKAPASMVRDQFRQEIDQEVVERLVPRYWRQAEAESGIEPMTQPELKGVEPPKLAGQPLTFTAVVETRPEITLGNIEDFTLPDLETEPTEAETTAALDDIRQQLGTWKTVERSAGTGDLVKIQVTEEPTGEATGDGDGDGEEAPAAQTVQVEVGSERVWEELSLALTGLSAGQKGDFERTETVSAGPTPPTEEHEIPDDAVGETTTRKFAFEVEEVQERELPELDDELAQKVSDGGLETVDALTEAVTARIRHTKTQKRHEERERALMNQLRERHPIDLPEGVVRQEVQGMLEEYAQNLASQGVDVSKVQLDWQGMGEQIRPAAEKKVHGMLLIDAVADALDFEVTADELERVLAEIADSQKVSTTQVRQAFDRDGRLAELKSRMRRSKTVRHLLGEPEPVPPGEDAAAAEDSADDSEE
jgi:trigger factor